MYLVDPLLQLIVKRIRIILLLFQFGLGCLRIQLDSVINTRILHGILLHTTIINHLSLESLEVLHFFDLLFTFLLFLLDLLHDLWKWQLGLSECYPQIVNLTLQTFIFFDHFLQILTEVAVLLLEALDFFDEIDNVLVGQLLHVNTLNLTVLAHFAELSYVAYCGLYRLTLARLQAALAATLATTPRNPLEIPCSHPRAINCVSRLLLFVLLSCYFVKYSNFFHEATW